MKNLNIEIKARCSDHGRIREVLKSHNALFVGIDPQTDTYFNINRGRLKLREGNIENALIYYERGGAHGPKKSEVILYQTQPGTSLKEILTKALGILAIIDKQREIYLIDNVKFHIDTVRELGTFIDTEG